MKHTTAQLKQQARNSLSGNWRKAVYMTVFSSCLTMLLSMCTNPFVSNTTTLGTVIYCVVSLIITLISGLFNAGIIYFYLNMCRGKEHRFSNIFAPFKMNPDRFLIVAFITSFATFATALPSIFWVPSEEEMLTYSIVSLGAMILGYLITIVLSFFFVLTNYLLLDFPDMGTREALKLSAALMKGNKGRYFRLMLSFFGLSILGALSFGIGFLWIQPYMSVTYTYFYADVLVSLNGDQSETEPSETNPTE